MKRIIVSVTNDISTDQRVAKVCNTLHKNGYEILLIGRKLRNSEHLHRPYKTKRIKLFFNKGFLFYAEYNFRLFFILFFLKKNFLLSNDLDTLLPNFLVSKLQNKKLIYDSHELFSEVPELVNKPFTKKIWLGLERFLYPKLKNNYTVCGSIANHYKKKYNSLFSVIKNVPTQKNIVKGNLPFETNRKKIIIYQGAINIGRGLELMIETMNYLENFVFVIIGSGDILKDLQEKVSTKKLNDKVIFLGKMMPKDLQNITPFASLGISLEEDLGLNYKFALPNKIFDYIQAEVPILVSNLPEMKQIVLNYNVGEIVIERNPKKIALQIKIMVEKDYKKQLQKAKDVLIWEKEEPKLLSIINNLT